MEEKIENAIWTLLALSVGCGIGAVLWLIASIAIIVFEG